MNLRCTYCQTPFSVGRMEKLAALQRMEAENLHHYDAFCPRCRRANSVSRQRLEMFTPGWREGLKTLEAEAAQRAIAIADETAGRLAQSMQADLAEVGVRSDVPTTVLREWADVFRCLGDYSPSPKSLKAAAIATIMDNEINLLEQRRQAEAAEEARCQADPKCIKQREVDAIAGELCSTLAEINEIEEQLKARLKEGKKYGVINKSDQYEDMEDKRSYEERAAELKRDYKEVAGKSFSRKVCSE